MVAMRIKAAILSLVAVFATCSPSFAQDQAGDDSDLPPAAKVRVDFDSHIKPILQGSCLKCHARGKYKGGLSMETREAILRGGEGGPAAVAGKSEESPLIELVAGLDPVRRMPEKGEPLTREQVGLLRAWIDQGMAWPDGFSFGFRRAGLAPRRPEVPASPEGLRLENPVDRFVARAASRSGTSLDWTPVSDRLFARRVHLDLVGLLPTPERLAAFEADRDPGKRAKLVASLLEDRRAYADHWLTFWNDLLRNAYRGTGFIDDGRKTITRWLYEALYENRPYDRFVHELVSPVPGTEGFTKGIVWRGVVNASQTPAVQAAQNVSQVFLGTNLKCASCHDSFVNYWKLKDAYALASVFAEKPLEIHRCDKPTGEISEVGFIYPELGNIQDDAPRAERMDQLADLLVKPENGRFARTVVNRLWAHLMGRGLVEPLDDMDQAPWDEDLLDWLASDFVEHGHDLKHTLALICTSRAYQLPSVGVADPSGTGSYAFRGPQVKRVSAEQFLDAMSTLTGVWPQAEGTMLKADGRGQGGQLAAVRAAVAAAEKEERGGTPDAPKAAAQWLWSHGDAEKDPGGRIFLRKVIPLESVPEKAILVATCDNELTVFVNGNKAGEGAEWSRPVAVDVTRWLRPGENVIAVEATNWPDREHGRGTTAPAPNPAAFIGWVGGFDGDRQVWGIGSDETWLWAKEAEGDGWKGRGFDADGWQHAVVLPLAGRIYGARVDLSASALEALAGPGSEELRAALVFDDPLLSAMGRTNREQVVTRRDSVATTLQALELTNGETLDAKLARGARRWVESHGGEPSDLVRRLYQTSFGREPTAAESDIALGLIGSPPTAEGVQDLLWILVMLPEFQLIY
jgi:hypothetical protein